MLRDAFQYPTAGRPGHGTTIGGTALVLAALILAARGVQTRVFLVGAAAVLTALWGYYLQVARCVIRSPAPPAPRLGDAAPVRDGGRVLVVVAGYLLPGAGLALLAQAARDVAPIVGALLLVLALVAFLAAFYLLPAALGLLAACDRTAAAFDLPVLVTIVDTEDYAVAWVLGTALRLAALVSVVLVVGVLFWFHAAVGATYIYTLGVRKAGKV